MSRGRITETGDAQGARRATEAAPDTARRGKSRCSARRKVTVVLELMRGADLEATSRKYAVTWGPKRLGLFSNYLVRPRPGL